MLSLPSTQVPALVGELRSRHLRGVQPNKTKQKFPSPLEPKPGGGLPAPLSLGEAAGALSDRETGLGSGVGCQDDAGRLSALPPGGRHWLPTAQLGSLSEASEWRLGRVVMLMFLRNHVAVLFCGSMFLLLPFSSWGAVCEEGLKMTRTPHLL